jgi:plastocyanin
MKKLILLNIFLAQASFAQEATIAGCKQGDFVQGSSQQAIITTDFSYSPKCVRVPKGATVTIVGSSMHPLQALDPVDGVRNPFLNQEGGSKTQTHTLSDSGVYGFFCTNHGNATGQGMAGAILVE